MASHPDTVQYVADQAGLGGDLTYKRMFGEYALYVKGKVVAFVCDDQLFLKPTPEGRALLGTVTEAPPYPGGKDWFLLTRELDDRNALRQVLLKTYEVLPEPKPKKPKKKG
ncbi:MAG: TfoX/Sxy family protein [Burkholderiales bacterium]|nr:TfoX/Sxy family protein [Burkholderiales bacterium]